MTRLFERLNGYIDAIRVMRLAPAIDARDRAAIKPGALDEGEHASSSSVAKVTATERGAIAVAIGVPITPAHR